MAKNKLKKFAEIAEMEHVLEFPEDIKGKWNNYYRSRRTINRKIYYEINRFIKRTRKPR